MFWIFFFFAENNELYDGGFWLALEFCYETQGSMGEPMLV